MIHQRTTAWPRVITAAIAVSCSASTDDSPLAEISLVAETRIGSETSGPEYQFTTISDIIAKGDQVYVVQRGIPEIRVFGDETSDGRAADTLA